MQNLFQTNLSFCNENLEFISVTKIIKTKTKNVLKLK